MPEFILGETMHAKQSDGHGGFLHVALAKIQRFSMKVDLGIA
jgi:hypothetical protein